MNQLITFCNWYIELYILEMEHLQHLPYICMKSIYLYSYILKLIVVKVSLMVLVMNCMTLAQCALVEVLENTLCVDGKLESMSSLAGNVEIRMHILVCILLIQ